MYQHKLSYCLLFFRGATKKYFICEVRIFTSDDFCMLRKEISVINCKKSRLFQFVNLAVAAVFSYS